ncbi:ribosome biogenesis GTPase Der [Candidatus Marinamargulisbacteria bacterium SCGC AG-414-C22]|nr:ribosome biogenesis GTPase Der [Candidatus Marinamargulisbacteria bacterium SCGC AG-414-C22]
MELPKVLILGRPNVGKSTLINRIVKKRSAITFDAPGITRDINQFLIDWKGIPFLMLDSGGIFLSDTSDFEFQDQVEVLVQKAIKDASKIIFLTDYKDGVLPVDEKIARFLRDCPEKVVLVTNKVDDQQHKEHLSEFYKLGFGQPVPISSLHGHGIFDMMKVVVKGFNKPLETVYKEDILKVALIGRTNVGKSSLLNVIFDDEKVIVSDQAGTTRDAAHFYFIHHNKQYEFIDTAGVRKKAKLKRKVDFYSSVRTEKVISDSDLLVVVLDAERGMSHQDKTLINKVFDEHKSLIIFVNKIDYFDDQVTFKKEFTRLILNDVPKLENYPILFGSAEQKKGIPDLFKTIPTLYETIFDRISTAQMNKFMTEVIKRFPAPAKYGKQVKVYYVTQIETMPPTFVFFVNHKSYVGDDYKRFLEKRMRTYLGGFFGHTLHLIFREHRTKDNDKDSKKK